LVWPGCLYRARRLLLDGGALFILADAWAAGREVFRVPLPGGCPLIIKPGWLTLWRHTGARVLPVTTHLEGRAQVITIHPPLPTPGPHDTDLPSAWPDILASLVTDYVRRFPEQCAALPFRKRLLPDLSSR
jgi:lauroyl/myristoyl acyltransferase